MANKLIKWATWDVAIFDTEFDARQYEASLDGLTHECPACKCSGRADGDPIKEEVLDEEAMAHQGFFARSVYKTIVKGHEQVPCEHCDGKGWTAEPLKPVTETKVVGWEKK
jgi:hypothetical protein